MRRIVIPFIHPTIRMITFYITEDITLYTIPNYDRICFVLCIFVMIATSVNAQYIAKTNFTAN